MLNKHQRGEVYFGINDEGKVCGQTVGERTIADITQTIRNHLKMVLSKHSAQDLTGHSLYVRKRMLGIIMIIMILDLLSAL